MPTAIQHDPAEVEQSIPIAVADRPPLEERRASRRVSRDLIATVQGHGVGQAFSGPAQDVSEGGLYLRVPLSHGLAVGQRCEVRLSDTAGVTPACLAGESCYVTVVRTEVITSGSQKLLGAGMRFDRPLFL